MKALAKKLVSYIGDGRKKRIVKPKLFAVTLWDADKWDEWEERRDRNDDRIWGDVTSYGEIIGEISPDATWVKDGDEIKGELYAIFTQTGEVADSLEFENLDKMGYPYKMMFKVKCPCCSEYK